MTSLMKPDESTLQEMLAMIPRLRRFARVLTGNQADADDIVQACLEKAMMNFDQWEPGSRLDRWMFRIARNLWVDDRRRPRNRLGHQNIDEMFDLVASDGMAEAEARAEAQMVRAAVDSLPREQRDVVALVMLEEYSYREAAETLGVPIGTVMSRLSRAKSTLAKRMNSQGAMQ
jgi:RNA polymerase sigma-70 factor (ECF subfamily)